MTGEIGIGRWLGGDDFDVIARQQSKTGQSVTSHRDPVESEGTIGRISQAAHFIRIDERQFSGWVRLMHDSPRRCGLARVGPLTGQRAFVVTLD